MEQGDEFRILRERGKAPLLSDLTGIVAVAVAAGFEFKGGADGRQKAFLDSTEATPEGPKREVTWAFENAGSITFRPIQRPVTISLGDLIAKAQDKTWLEGNPDHPLALAVAAVTQLLRLQRKMVMDPAKSDEGVPDPELGWPLIRHDLVRKGKRRYFLKRHWTTERKLAEIAKLEKAE